MKTFNIYIDSRHKWIRVAPQLDQNDVIWAYNAAICKDLETGTFYLIDCYPIPESDMQDGKLTVADDVVFDRTLLRTLFQDYLSVVGAIEFNENVVEMLCDALNMTREEYEEGMFDNIPPLESLPNLDPLNIQFIIIGYGEKEKEDKVLRTLATGQSDITRHESLINQLIAPMYDQGYIKWDDPEVKRIILQYYNNANGTNKTELTKDEVLEITLFKGILSSNENITSLNDLQYFTNWSMTYQGTSGPELDEFINIWSVKSIIFPEFDESVAFTQCYINGLRDLEYIEFPESIDLRITPFIYWWNDAPTHHVTIKLKNPNPSDIFVSGTFNGEPYIFLGLNDASDFTILVPQGSKLKYMDKFVDVNNNGYSESHYEEY